MNTRSLGRLTAPALAVALAATLTGCSALSSALGQTAEPAQRDEPGGEITASAQADVFSIKLGDCLDYASMSSATEIDSVPTVPCADPHDAEIYAETTLTEEQFQADLALAGQPETPTSADTFCYDAFAGFVGKSYEESTLDFTPLTPTEQSWEQGDDVVQCILVHPDGGFTGSMQNSAI